jgi:polyhydroxyalkanoate synthesis regulator phasin
MLDISDEIDAHQKRLAEPLAEYARTGDNKLQAEIQRQIRAIEQRLAELAGKRGAVVEDVLDQFVHQGAMADQQAEGCFAEVTRLVERGDAAGAQAAAAKCRQQLDQATAAMESGLRELRGDR